MHEFGGVVVKHVFQRAGGQTAGMDALNFRARVMERRINAEHDPFRPHGFIGIPDLASHGHAGHFEEEVVVFFRHVDAAFDVHAVTVAHVYHHRGHFGVAFGEQTDLPGQGIGRVSAMDEYRLVVRLRDVHDGIDHGRVGGEGVEERLHLDAGEALVAQIMFKHVVSLLAEVGIDPAKRNDALRHGVPGGVHFFVEMRSRRAQNGFFNVVLVHLTGEKFRVEVDVEGTAEKTDMGMGVDFFEEVENIIETKNIKHYIFDVRGNPGGDSEIIKPLLRYLNENNITGVTLTDNRVFSSGTWAVRYAKTILNTTLIGQPLGQGNIRFGKVLARLN